MARDGGSEKAKRQEGHTATSPGFEGTATMRHATGLGLRFKNESAREIHLTAKPCSHSHKGGSSLAVWHQPAHRCGLRMAGVNPSDTAKSQRAQSGQIRYVVYHDVRGALHTLQNARPEGNPLSMNPLYFSQTTIRGDTQKPCHKSPHLTSVQHLTTRKAPVLEAHGGPQAQPSGAPPRALCFLQTTVPDLPQSRNGLVAPATFPS